MICYQNNGHGLDNKEINQGLRHFCENYIRQERRGDLPVHRSLYSFNTQPTIIKEFIMVVAMQKSVQCTVVGDGLVGKSSLVKRLISGKFHQEYVATLKDDYVTKLSANGDAYTLNVSDIAGEVS